MYTSWLQGVLALILALLCRQSYGFWPSSIYAAADASTSETETLYDSSAKRVAIIGAGAAGASTAYHLRQFAATSGIPLNITVYERSQMVGGRTTTVNAYDNPLERVELGASIFVEVNTILMNATKAFGLKPKESETDDPETLGIWNGQTFVYTQKESGWKYWDIAKLLWKYGLAPIRTQRLMKSTVGQFQKLYDIPWRSLSDRVLDLGLTPVTAATGAELLAANKIGAPFTTDIIQASTRVNYAQNLHHIHGMGAMVCMAIEGAMQVDGGNWLIFENMIKASNATLLLNTTVSGITKTKGKYGIKTTSRHASGTVSSNEEPFDTVVLAAPLQFSDLNIEGGLLNRTPDEIPYVSLHVTLFTSPKTLDPIFFNLAPDAEVPSSILTTLPPDEFPEDPHAGAGSPGFFSISTLRQVTNPKTLKPEYLYKIFSPKVVTSDFLSGILGIPIPTDLRTLNIDSGDAITWYYPHLFKSYPYEYPRVTFEDPDLAPNFYYTSGMESFISTMETSALMGMNVAQLIVDDYTESTRDIMESLEKPPQVVFSGNEKLGHVEEL